MFKFGFDTDDEAFPASTQPQEKLNSAEQRPFTEIILSQLLDCLPPLISYSPLSVPLSSGRSLTLVRRDLFDARFQLISEVKGEAASDAPEPKHTLELSALEYLAAPSDLLPGIYEGGLKTWECSLDLVDYLDGLKDGPEHPDIHGKRIIEIGCGTAVPSLYLLRELFSTMPTVGSDTNETHIHLQDYNSSVLELVTLPNVLLTWYMSPSSASYRRAGSHSLNASDTFSALDPSFPSELPISPELKSAFISSLREHKISLRFFYGSWSTFDLSAAGGKYDIVLTSETIYRRDSLPSLIKLMQAACGCPERPLEAPASPQLPIHSLSSSVPYLCLVAAKVLYFGVGGGVSEFILAAEGQKDGCERGSVKTVWERKVGVGRRVLLVQWPASRS